MITWAAPWNLSQLIPKLIKSSWDARDFNWQLKLITGATQVDHRELPKLSIPRRWVPSEIYQWQLKLILGATKVDIVCEAGPLALWGKAVASHWKSTNDILWRAQTLALQVEFVCESQSQYASGFVQMFSFMKLFINKHKFLTSLYK